MNDVKDKVFSGLAWRLAEKFGSQGMQFLVSLFLARMLTPEDYGLIGLLTVFIAISNVFIQSGLGQALIQKKDADNLDFSTVFFLSIIMSCGFYAVLFISAPFLSNFYGEEILTPVVRVLALTLIIGAVLNIQQTYVQKTMQFKRFFFATLLGTIGSSIVGFVMAFNGFGVWTLVGQQISNQLINTIALWVTVKWRPIASFSLKRAKELFSFGWRILFSSLIDTVYNNMYSLIIGKFYTATEVGYYNRGNQFPMLIIVNINSTIDSVFFPVLSQLQDDFPKMRAAMKRAITTSTFLVFPAMAGLAGIAEPMIRIVLTDKWLPAVPFVQFCCFIYAFWPIHTTNLQVIKAIGRSDVFLKLEITNKIIGFIVLIITIPFGLKAMMIGRCVVALISSFINAMPNHKFLNYSYFQQIKDVAPTVLLSLAMYAVVLTLNMLSINLILKCGIQIVVGIILYIGGAVLLKLECFEYLLKNVSKMKIKVSA